MRRLFVAAGLGLLFSAGAVIGPAIEWRASAQGTVPVATTTFPNRRYNQGVDTFGPVSIPVGATKLTLRATRDGWPDTGAEVIQIMARLSLNGGNTWVDWAGFGTYGGDARQRDGSIAAESTMVIDLPDPQNPQRQLRGVITIQRALNTAITVTTE